MYPKISHFLFPTALIILGSYCAHIGGAGWYAAVGLWFLAILTVLWIDMKTAWDARYDYTEATARLFHETQALSTEQLDRLGIRYPTLKLKAQPSPRIELDDTGVTLEWFRDVFMANSNAVSCVALHSFAGLDREINRRNWYSVTKFLAKSGMFAAGPRGNVSYLWRDNAYEFCLMLAGYQGYPLQDFSMAEFRDEMVE